MENPYRNTLGFWAKQLNQAASSAIDAQLRQAGIGRTQWRILFHLQRVHLVTQSELRAFLDIESATLSGIIDTLVRKGWVEKRLDESDRRGKVLTLTKQGKQRAQTIPDPFEIITAKMLQGIDARALHIAQRTLEQAVNNLQKIRRIL